MPLGPGGALCPGVPPCGSEEQLSLATFLTTPWPQQARQHSPS